MKKAGTPLAKLLEECKETCLKDDVKRFYFIMPVGMISERMDRAFGFSQSGGVGVICARGLRQMTYAKPLDMSIVFVNQEDDPAQTFAGLRNIRVHIFNECSTTCAQKWELAYRRIGDLT